MAVFSRSNILPEGVDNSWSWFLCILAALCNALHFGVSLSFGVLFPYLLEHFTESIDITGTVRRQKKSPIYGIKLIYIHSLLNFERFFCSILIFNMSGNVR